MRVLLDTNVVLDRVLEREPWFGDSTAFWQLIRQLEIRGIVPASAVTDVFYVVRRQTNLAVADHAVRECLNSFEIWTVDRTVLEQAAALPGSEFEDNVQIVCALQAGVEAIVTRDAEGFRLAPLPVLTPQEAVERLQAES